MLNQSGVTSAGIVFVAAAAATAAAAHEVVTIVAVVEVHRDNPSRVVCSILVVVLHRGVRKEGVVHAGAIGVRVIPAPFVRPSSLMHVASAHVIIRN